MDARLQAHSYPAANYQLPGKLVHVRYVVLKNLAILLAKRQATAAKALDLFTEAAIIDGSDVLVWNHFSSLVCPAGSGCGMCASMSSALHGGLEPHLHSTCFYVQNPFWYLHGISTAFCHLHPVFNGVLRALEPAIA